MVRVQELFALHWALHNNLAALRMLEVHSALDALPTRPLKKHADDASHGS